MNLKKKILITGYNGYIGRHLTNFLDKKKIKYLKINIEKINKLHFKNFTHFIHLQFYIKNLKSNILKNYKNINKVIRICEQNKLFLIFSSTAAFKFKYKKKIMNDINIINNYTFSKDQCEKEILKAYKNKKLKYIIFRIFNVYGGDLNNKYYISNIIKKFSSNSKKMDIKYYENVRDYIHINDLSNLIYKSINKKIVGIFEVASGKNISVKNLVIKIKRLYKSKKKIYFKEPKKTLNNDYSRSNIKKTIKNFNWKPKTTLDSGLRELMNI
jgi:nucleoside-diphosphate-sugar epimerase